MVRISSFLAASASVVVALAAPIADQGSGSNLAHHTSLSASIFPPIRRSPPLFHVLHTSSLLPTLSSDGHPHPLLARVSHVIIKVEVPDEGVRLNGVDVPLLPASKGGVMEEEAEVLLQLPSVQMLKVPDNSPVLSGTMDAEGRFDPQALEGLVKEYRGEEGAMGAKVTVRRERIGVVVMGDKESVGEGWKVDIRIQILTLHGHSLIPAALPPIHLHFVRPASPDSTHRTTHRTTASPLLPYVAEPHSHFPRPGAGFLEAFKGAAGEAERKGEGVKGWMGRVRYYIRGKGKGRKEMQEGPTEPYRKKYKQEQENGEGKYLSVEMVGGNGEYLSPPFDFEASILPSPPFHPFSGKPTTSRGWRNRHFDLWRQHRHPPQVYGHSFHTPCWFVQVLRVVWLVAVLAVWPVLVGWAGVRGWRWWARKCREGGDDREERGDCFQEKKGYVMVLVEEVEVLPRYEEKAVAGEQVMKWAVKA